MRFFFSKRLPGELCWGGWVGVLFKHSNAISFLVVQSAVFLSPVPVPAQERHHPGI